MSALKLAKSAASLFVAVSSLLLTTPVWAEAGRVMYVSGEASLTRGGIIPVTKGMAVESGDIIKTGSDGRVQLLMADGDRIALRPNTDFSIDEFSGPTRSKPGEPVPDTQPSSWKSFYTLAKGGMRTLTQSLGQRDSSSYQVRTPVATIGIRGTDYTLLYCPETCQPYTKVGQGLRVEGMQASVFRESAGTRLLFAALGTGWVQQFLKAAEQDSGGGSGVVGRLLGGVSNGEIEVTGPDGNKYIVKNDEFFQAGQGGFKRLTKMPDGLSDGTDSEGEGNFEEQVEGEGEFSGRTSPVEGRGDGQNEGQQQAGQGEPPVQSIQSSGGELTGGQTPFPGKTAAVSFVGPRGSTGTPRTDSQATVQPDSQGGIDAFRVSNGGIGTITYSRGTASNVDTGRDLNDGTSLQWGRWANGAATFQNSAGGGGNITLCEGKPGSCSGDAGSLHWIFGTDPAVIAVTGTYDYQLIGNTNPTDNLGNVGTLGSGYLRANFSQGTGQITDGSLSLDIDQRTWNANGANGTINGDGSFSGSYQSVGITDQRCSVSCSPSNGSGSFGGFFTGGDASNPPAGAGMTYTLQGDVGSSSPDNREVNGAAAFSQGSAN